MTWSMTWYDDVYLAEEQEPTLEEQEPTLEEQEPTLEEQEPTLEELEKVLLEALDDEDQGGPPGWRARAGALLHRVRERIAVC